MRRKGPRRRLATRQLGQIGTNGAHVGGTRVGTRSLAPGRKALQPRGVGRYRMGRQPLDTRDISDKRVNGIVEVKGYDRSPPNKSERVAK